MSNVTPIRQHTVEETMALFAAIPQRCEPDYFSEEAKAFYGALSMLPPAERDQALEATGDWMVKHQYELWLNDTN